MSFRFIPPMPPPLIVSANNDGEYTVEGLLIAFGIVLFALGLGVFLGWLSARGIR